MVVALLILIALILLFGAGVIQGWLSKLATMMLGTVISVTMFVLGVLWLGETGFYFVVFGGAALVLIAKAVPVILDDLREQRRLELEAAMRRETQERIKAARRPLQMSTYRPTKAEKKSMKKRYLQQRTPID